MMRLLLIDVEIHARMHAMVSRRRAFSHRQCAHHPSKPGFVPAEPSRYVHLISATRWSKRASSAP